MKACAPFDVLASAHERPGTSWIVAILALQLPEDAPERVDADCWANIVQLARTSVGHRLTTPIQLRWLFGDLGRRSLLIAAAVLDTRPDGLSAAGLADFATLHGICSRGRARSFFDTATQIGVFRRRARRLGRMGASADLSPEFAELLRAQIEIGAWGLKAAGLVDADIFPWLMDEAAFRRLRANLPVAASFLKTPLFPPEQILTRILAIEGGQAVLEALIVAEADEGGLARGLVSVRAGVQRTQAHRILGLAADANALRVDNGLVRLGPELKAAIAFQLRLALALLLVALHISDAPVKGGP